MGEWTVEAWRWESGLCKPGDGRVVKKWESGLCKLGDGRMIRLCKPGW